MTQINYHITAFHSTFLKIDLRVQAVNFTHYFDKILTSSIL